MLGASAGFILPYSYQTNLMVFAGERRSAECSQPPLYMQEAACIT
jgi:hypothetical protein